MRKSKYPVLKQELKELAKELRYWKSKRKFDARRELGMALWRIESKIDGKRHEFRHKHIAYCQLRGRERYQIECPADNNLPNEELIERIMADHAENVCASAERSA